ncbi:MAG: class I SAM-dependent methyltransferase [Candidatus Altiarchaeales archaeon]|nr:class I SAM-dependent methyltransferase [Candidatus Altiarchaeales archaeon]
MRPDEGKPYYTAYDKRYKSAYAQGADHWLYLPEYEATKSVINKYVSRYKLAGKKIVDFGCGEGLFGIEFAKLGCVYQGYDVALSVIVKARELLSTYPNAIADYLDLVTDPFPGEMFDAGIDIACLHMLVTDIVRTKYLGNVFRSLKPDAPMFFVNEAWRVDAFKGEVSSYEQWLDISRDDVDTPTERAAVKDGKVIPVKIPLIAARARTRSDYEEELSAAGFRISEIVESETNINVLVIRG